MCGSPNENYSGCINNGLPILTLTFTIRMDKKWIRPNDPFGRLRHNPIKYIKKNIKINNKKEKCVNTNLI